MQIPEEAVLLRIFIGESDRWEHKPLYENHCAQGTRDASRRRDRLRAARWAMGKTSRLHTAKILNLSTDLPLVIEIVDSEAAINAFFCRCSIP